jgi:protein-L-isoaspartate(D-aspartate) O-methyltransferase
MATIQSLLLISLFFIFQQDIYESKRLEMVTNQIEARGINDQKVLNAMKKVPRHLFVPSQYESFAYDDRPMPIGHGQTISQPFIVGFMTQAINPTEYSKVLEIGTGSGYQAAVLAEIVDKVYTLEIVDALAEESAKRLKNLGYKNVFAKRSDGYHGWSKYAPFDAIVVTAAAEDVPPPLFEQLKEGGKMVIPIGPVFSVQSMVLITKKNGKMKRQDLFGVRFVPFTRD